MGTLLLAIFLLVFGLNIIIGLSLAGAIIYEVLKRREESQAERDKENAKLAERSDLGEAAPAGLK